MIKRSGKSPPSFCQCGTSTKYRQCPSDDNRQKARAGSYLAILIVYAVAIVFGCPSRALARSLQDILGRQTFSICAHPDAAPFSMRVPRASGLQIDLARAVADQLGVQVQEEWVMFRRDARQVGCDAVMAGIARDRLDNDRQAGESRQALGAVEHGPVTSRAYAASLTRVVVGADAAPIGSIRGSQGPIRCGPAREL